jgi:hypothetical protein
MPIRTSDGARMRRELLATAEDLNNHGAMSESELKRVRALCAPATKRHRNPIATNLATRGGNRGSTPDAAPEKPLPRK